MAITNTQRHKGHPCLINKEFEEALGFDKGHGYPIALYEQEFIKNKINDEQLAVNRYVWENLPVDISSQMLERFLYEKGQLMFFYLEELDQYFFMSYNSIGAPLDLYGRVVKITPLAEYSNQPTATLLATKDFTVLYDSPKRQNKTKMRGILDVIKSVFNKNKDEVKNNYCALLFDYTPGVFNINDVKPRAKMNEPLSRLMAECVAYDRTAMVNSSGVRAVKVGDDDEGQQILEANKAIQMASATGQPLIPITGKGGIDFQELTGGTASAGNCQDFLLNLQGLENHRLAGYGLDNSGVMVKKEHTLQSEQNMNGGQTNLLLDDGLKQRQHFCDIVNDWFGLNISVSVNGSAMSAQQDTQFEPADYEDSQAEGE